MLSYSGELNLNEWVDMVLGQERLVKQAINLFLILNRYIYKRKWPSSSFRSLKEIESKIIENYDRIPNAILPEWPMDKV